MSIGLVRNRPGSRYLAPSPDSVYSHFGSFTPVTDADGNIVGLTSPFFRLPNPEA